MEPIYVDKILLQKMFGICVREAREARGLSLNQLRDMTGIAPSRLEQIEGGGTVVREGTRKKLRGALEISEDYWEQLVRVARISFIDELTKIWWSETPLSEEIIDRIP